jgi:hypothetical protein
VKRKVDGTLDKYKARLVAKGSNKGMALTMKIYLVLLLRCLPLELLYLLLSQRAGV